MRNYGSFFKTQSKKVQGLLLASAGLLFTLCSFTQAFTQVTISTGAPSSLEANFISATTQQFESVVVKNPLAANTYAIKLFGLNPAYNAPEAPPSNLEQALSLGATVYVYGFANGMTYQENVVQSMVGTLSNLCESATSFMLVQTSSNTFDRSTCQDTLGTLLDQLFTLSLSTPTPLPPEP